jgi:methylamine dehydrogenase accessory protein MauD
MSPLFWTTYVLLWVLVAILVVAVLLLYRQFGLVYMNSRRRLDMQGPDIGGRAPTLEVVTVPARERASINWQAPTGSKGQFVLFALPTCQVCKALLPDLSAVPAQFPEVGFAWVHGATSLESALESAPSLSSWSVLAGDAMRAHQVFDVGTVPFAFVLDANGRIRSKGLINDLDDIGRLIREARVSSERLSEPAERNRS